VPVHHAGDGRAPFLLSARKVLLASAGPAALRLANRAPASLGSAPRGGELRAHPGLVVLPPGLSERIFLASGLRTCASDFTELVLSPHSPWRCSFRGASKRSDPKFRRNIR